MLAVFDLRPFGFAIVGAYSATATFGRYSWKHHCRAPPVLTPPQTHRGGEAEDGSTIKGWVGGWGVRVTSVFSEVIC